MNTKCRSLSWVYLKILVDLYGPIGLQMYGSQYAYVFHIYLFLIKSDIKVGRDFKIKWKT